MAGRSRSNARGSSKSRKPAASPARKPATSPAPKAATPRKASPSPARAAKVASPAALPASRLITATAADSRGSKDELLGASSLFGALGFLAHKAAGVAFLSGKALAAVKVVPEASAAYIVSRNAKARGQFGGVTAPTLVAGYLVLQVASAIAGSFQGAGDAASVTLAALLRIVGSLSAGLLFLATLFEESATPTFWPAAAAAAAIMYGIDTINGVSSACCAASGLAFVGLAISVGRLFKALASGKDTKKVVPAAAASLILSSWFTNNILPTVLSYSPLGQMLGADAALAKEVTVAALNYVAVYCLVRSA